ncbi:C69 family dipeptidase [Prevotella melaninogenica]|jgi:probable dipeptidase|uniref:C69 family dipeptidase n=1 Tax=Prevotella melaninogenica TaxID=28132 RepID=UPI001C5D39B4|nr:C69 family dipeptidase [Prevotella melaninogenica]MBW4727878.1 C69 family dipeptidase [Prevotella melaninogenica]MBW4730416.1 C69 family dipeptidase [Prevotella melaninogenica]MBW4748668.1 C69 family dipeptidase [Prevotella melaninogenica]
MKTNKVQIEHKLPSECTTIIIGQEQTADGSMIVARSEDWDAMEAKNYEIFEDTDNGPREFVAKDSPFRCELPEKALGYSALSPYNLHGHWGSAGFNTAGVGMSATESIFSSDEVLKHDPLVENGVAENSVFNITLPYVRTAREGVERLGLLIEKYGIAEGFGIGFVDSKEIWYLETACGHRWLACRIPKDQYFVTGNQSRFRTYDPNDKENYLASADLIEFAEKHGLYNPAQGSFDFHEAYARDIKLDTTYNYPRVWGLQQFFSPEIKNDVTKNTFPVFAKAAHKVTLTELRTAFRFHYDNTEHDPYLNSNPKEPYRPVSIFRTTQTHLLQVRPELPQAIGCVNYVAMGMADLGVFLPLYQGITSYPEAYTKGNGESSDDSAYWKFRKIMVLGMTNYNKYAPVIKEAYAKFEAETDQRQREMEEEYLRIYKTQPLHAQDLLQSFSDKILNSALDLADRLQEKLFTLMTQDIQQEYLFHGA